MLLGGNTQFIVESVMPDLQERKQKYQESSSMIQADDTEREGNRAETK